MSGSLKHLKEMWIRIWTLKLAMIIRYMRAVVLLWWVNWCILVVKKIKDKYVSQEFIFGMMHSRIFLSRISTLPHQRYFWYLNFNLNFLKVLKLDGCRMIRQPDLSFDVVAPACNSFAGRIPRILICFSYYDTKVCHT